MLEYLLLKMMGHIEFREFFPDRAPTWTEALLVGMVAAFIIVPRAVSDQSLSWPAVVAGFLAFGVALGPAGTTRAGKRVSEWFGTISAGGRLAMIGLFAGAVMLSQQIALVPNALVSDAAVGGLVLIVLYFATHVALAGGVSGWRACCG